MSSEQNPATPKSTGNAGNAGAGAAGEDTEHAGPRPPRLTYAAALVGLEGLALVVGGLWILVLGVTGDPDDRQQAVTGGVTLMVLALLPLLAARGLLGRRSWSRGPAVITQIMALPVAYNLLQADSMAIPAGIALAATAVAALVLIVNGETTRALGIRGPGNAEDSDSGVRK
ncbi:MULTISPECIES: hypothetical protein [Streptomyces]|uniref:hypothetical protein n=1 Tax=Streptomyces TaxID=1883 RepID=UPI0019A88B18|nr:hypothetical protein GCM10010350_62100 [Streptomyces galilaeus]